jgi:hypothetical protein
LGLGAGGAPQQRIGQVSHTPRLRGLGNS